MKRKLLTLLLGVTTLTAFGQVPSYVPTNGLVGWWPFNGNANDESGNQNHGTINGATPTTDRNGVANKAFSFDGINDYILVNNSVSLNMSSITISGWVNLHISPTGTVGQSGDIALVNKWYQQINCDNNNDSYNIEIGRVNNSPVLLGATTLYSGTSFASNTSLSLDNWVYFTFIHNSLIGGKLYVNGNLVASNTLSGAICNSTNSLYFGADNNQ